MSGYILCRLKGARATLRFKKLWTLRDKLRGLLGTGADAQPVALCRCSSVHTAGMRYAIDVALVDKSGIVLASKRRVAPWRMVSAAGAYYALERPHGEGPWPETGTLVSVAECA